MTDSIKGALQHLAASVSSSVRRNSAGPEQFGSAPLHHVSSDVDLRALPADSTAAAAAASGSSSEQLPSMSSPLPGGSASGDDNTAFSTVPLSSATSQQAAYARILDDLPNKAEWSSLAHRGTIDPMQQTQYAAQPPSADSSLSAAAASSGSAARPLFRKTGIICTIGPGTNSPSALADLRKAGMNIMRMNFSHGDHAYHQSAIDNLRKSFDVYPGPPVAVALDTKVRRLSLTHTLTHTTARSAISATAHSLLLCAPPRLLRAWPVSCVLRGLRSAQVRCVWARWS